MQALLHRIPPEKMNFNPPLQSICCAAAPLPKEIVPQLQKLWPTCLMRQGWGMTETATAVAFTPQGSPQGFSHTCGPILPNAEAVIIDPERGNSIEPGKGQGELWVRAPSITLGYINNPKETQEMFNIGGQGWMRSGDEAEFEKGNVLVDGEVKEEWRLCIRDRLKELIKVLPPSRPNEIEVDRGALGIRKPSCTCRIGECAGCPPRDCRPGGCWETR